MTIYSEQNKVTYIADGQASTYVIPFYFLENNITVYQNQIEKTKDIDYVIQKNANSLGGTILFNKTPNKDDKIIIKRTTKLTQEVMFLEGESFPASDFETSLDKIVMSLQELKESLSRCISIDYTTKEAFCQPRLAISRANAVELRRGIAYFVCRSCKVCNRYGLSVVIDFPCTIPS